MSSEPPADSPGALPRWQRWVLPAVIGTEGAQRDANGGTDVPRSPRDWVVDLLFFGFALISAAGSLFGNRHEVSTTMFVIDGVLGVPSCLLVWQRRRHPLAVGLIAVGLSTVSQAAGGAAIVAMFTVAVHCAPRRTMQVGALSVVAAATSAAIYTTSYYAYGTLAFRVVATIAVVGFGMYVRARRELLLSLQERARRAEDEQHLRVREAQLAERARIAREMHDVLAHRISLLSVHAGALEFNPGASAEEIARAAAVIRVSARAAQEELREVIGVLRAGSEELEDLQPPQPTIGDLPRLVEESRAAGMDVSFKDALQAGALSPILGRTVYRVVQEALTNVRKHAPGQVVTITLDGDRGGEVRVEVVNRPWVGQAPSSAPGAAGTESADDHVGAGMGLVGLNERVTLVGGRLVSEPLAGGGFRLEAALPWHDAEADEESGT